MYTFFCHLLTTPVLILFSLEKPSSFQDQVIFPSGIFTPSNSCKYYYYYYYYCLLLLSLVVVVVVEGVVLSSSSSSSSVVAPAPP
jgi:hypothetical protein